MRCTAGYAWTYVSIRHAVCISFNLLFILDQAILIFADNRYKNYYRKAYK